MEALPHLGITVHVKLSFGVAQVFATEDGQVALDLNGVYIMTPADAEAVEKALHMVTEFACDIREAM